MTPLPAALGGKDLVAWRIDKQIHAPAWDEGQGSFLSGGRWNGKGTRAVYCALDPATAILEVAVHKGFAALDTVPHTLTSMIVNDPSRVHVVQASSIPNPNWLVPGVPSAGQQAFGDSLLTNNAFVALPSVVSRHSWVLVFLKSKAAGLYKLLNQEPFALDTRLHSPTP